MLKVNLFSKYLPAVAYLFCQCYTLAVIDH